MSDTTSGPTFLIDWTTSHEKNWQQLLGHLAGEPVRMLEVGCLEGRSSIWFCENILTHADSHLICVDPKPRDNFESNLAAAGVADRVELLEQESRQVLPLLPDGEFEAAYIDGSHEAADVLRDALEVLPKMTPGGVIIFDDYAHENLPGRHVMPGVGIDAFLTVAEPHFVETIFKNWQLAVRVK